MLSLILKNIQHFQQLMKIHKLNDIIQLIQLIYYPLLSLPINSIFQSVYFHHYHTFYNYIL